MNDVRTLRPRGLMQRNMENNSAIRDAIMRGGETDCCRLLHGAGDGRPGWYVEKLGGFLLSQSDGPLRPEQRRQLDGMAAKDNAGVYHKILDRHVRGASAEAASPQHVCGPAAPERFVVVENGVKYELSFGEGYSYGLFLDQRDNRRRILERQIAPGFPLLDQVATGGELLNTFAYTCAFSVCAAKVGLRATSLDLSKKYLDWGRRNFEVNSLDPAAHDFIYGDAFNWMKRLAKKGRRFDFIILDPPTFSRSKEYGEFRADRNYGELIAAALPLLPAGGVLLASTNAARYEPGHFLADIRRATADAGRKIAREFFAGQPADFPATAAEPAYLKTVWLRIA